MVPLYHRPRSSSETNGSGSAADARKSSRKLAYWPAPTSVVEATVRANNRTCSHTRSWNLGRGCQTTNGAGSKLTDVLEVFARLEPNRTARRDAHFFAGA